MNERQYNRIKAVLAEKKITNKKLGALINVSPTTISRWCSNARQPTIETLYEIAEILDIDVRELLIPNKGK